MTNELAIELPLRLPVNKGGRETTLDDPKRRRIVLRSVGRGMTFELAAECAGIVASTLWSYRRKHPKFEQQIQEAIAKGIQNRLNIVLKCMRSKDESIKLRAAIFWLTHSPYARKHFSDSTRLEVEAIGQIGFVIPKETLDRIAEARREHERQLNGNGSPSALPEARTT